MLLNTDVWSNSCKVVFRIQGYFPLQCNPRNRLYIDIFCSSHPDSSSTKTSTVKFMFQSSWDFRQKRLKYISILKMYNCIVFIVVVGTYKTYVYSRDLNLCDFLSDCNIPLRKRAPGAGRYMLYKNDTGKDYIPILLASSYHSCLLQIACCNFEDSRNGCQTVTNGNVSPTMLFVLSSRIWHVLDENL